MTRNGPGTWSSDRDEVMSPAECFWRGGRHQSWSGRGEISGRKTWLWNQTHPKGRVSKHDDDKVNGVSKKHEHVDVCDCAVLWVDQIMEELPHGKVDLHEPTNNMIISRNTDIRLKGSFNQLDSWAQIILLQFVICFFFFFLENVAWLLLWFTTYVGFNHFSDARVWRYCRLFRIFLYHVLWVL